MILDGLYSEELELIAREKPPLVGQIPDILLVNRLVSLTLRGEMRVGLRAELIFVLSQLFWLERSLHSEACSASGPYVSEIDGQSLPGGL